MIHHLAGTMVHKSSTQVVIECAGVGYLVHISLHTYEQLGASAYSKLLIFPVYREDSQSLFGFVTEDERELFKQLLSVSGIGANTARLILSAMTPEALKQAILTENDETLRKIKGIGPKSAKRMVLELKDKIAKGEDPLSPSFSTQTSNTLYNEALSGLSILGFDKIKAGKVLNEILKQDGNIQVETLLKEAIKRLH